MHINLSNIGLTIAIALTAGHLTAFFSVLLLREPLGIEKLNDIVVFWSIYLPLVPWKIAEAPVFQSSSAMFPSPNILGWLIALISWVLLYVSIGWLVQKIIRKLK